MTLILTEGFEDLLIGSNPAQLSAFGFESGQSEMTVRSPGRFGYGQFVSYNLNNTVMSCRWSMPKHFTESYMGMAVFMPRLPSPVTDPPDIAFGFLDATDDSFKISVVLRSGMITVHLGAHNGTLLASSIPDVWRRDTWFYLEIGLKISDTVGMVEVRINNAPYISLVNIDTNPGGAFVRWNQIAVRTTSLAISNPYAVGIDDVYVNDENGSVNNSFLGNARAQTLFANAPGDVTQWDRINSGLANWQNASNKSTDDTLYVYTPVNSESDLYNFEPLINSPAVFGVQVKLVMRQDDATQRTATARIKVGSTTSTGGVVHSLAQTYFYYRNIWQLSPDTGIGFTPAEINTIQAGPYSVS